MKYIFTIQEKHLKMSPIQLKQNGINYFLLNDCMGRLQKNDVGKRVYSNGEFYQVENDSQRDKRLTTIKAK